MGVSLWYQLTAMAIALVSSPIACSPAVPVQKQTTAQVQENAVTIHADFSRWDGPPLAKTKFAVYQTPFLSRKSLLRSTEFLGEAGVQDIRYEMGWGKPDTYAFDQIKGDAVNPTIDFSALDPFVEKLREGAIHPLFALTYNPLPFKNGTDWQRWKDAPNNTEGYRSVVRRYAEHYRTTMRIPGAFYEVWNEPDLPGDGGMVFFNGKPEGYAPLYDAAAPGVRSGDPDAAVGGAGIAYDHAYIRPILATKQPVDFVSIHAYANYASQLNNLRGLVKDRPELPLLMTEYASYDKFGKDAPISRHDGAMRFFKDVHGLLTFTDTPKVYWAQWVDDDLGMITRDFHRKAIFNAYTLYQKELPVDRSPVTVVGSGVNALAGADEHRAGIALWNETAEEKTVTVHLDKLPFVQGNVAVYRIDADNASYTDNPAKERLTALSIGKFAKGVVKWQGKIPGESVVFLKLTGDSTAPTPHKALGKFVRSYYWFPDRQSTAYADFDPHTMTARVGMGGHASGIAQIGTVLDGMPSHLSMQVTRRGPFFTGDANALFGVRLDFGDKNGGYSKSVLLHDGSYNPLRTTVLPWGKGGTAPDISIIKKEMMTGKAFTVDLKALAPANWKGRIFLTPILENRGIGSSARITLF